MVKFDGIRTAPKEGEKEKQLISQFFGGWVGAKKIPYTKNCHNLPEKTISDFEARYNVQAVNKQTYVFIISKRLGPFALPLVDHPVSGSLDCGFPGQGPFQKGIEIIPRSGTPSTPIAHTAVTVPSAL